MPLSPLPPVLAKLFAAISRRAKTPPRRSRPAVEQIEDRVAAGTLGLLEAAVLPFGSLDALASPATPLDTATGRPTERVLPDLLNEAGVPLGDDPYPFRSVPDDGP